MLKKLREFIKHPRFCKNPVLNAVCIGLLIVAALAVLLLLVHFLVRLFVWCVWVFYVDRGRYLLEFFK